MGGRNTNASRQDGLDRMATATKQGALGDGFGWTRGIVIEDVLPTEELARERGDAWRNAL